MKHSIILFVFISFALITGCNPIDHDRADLPHWTFSPDMIFPSDQSLNRPEDGVALADGRLIVTDQETGLRLIAADGTHRPFGKMREAGYAHNPPAVEGCANGVSMNPAGTHVLVADVYRGGIYSVEIATEETEKIYQHEFGINTARYDSNGGIWFSQSTRNRPDEGENGLWRSVNVAVADGAVCYLPPADKGANRMAVSLVGDFLFTNGLVLDEEKGILYVAESMGNRIRRYKVDVAAGTIREQMATIDVSVPDNLEMDSQGRLWIACPMRSEIMVYDPETDAMESVFRIPVSGSEELNKQINARIETGQPWLDLMAPGIWEPAPGLMTGIILSPDERTVYSTGLGKAIIRLER